MRSLFRLLLLRRLLGQSRRRHRRSTWGYGHRRPSYGRGYGRPRGRSQVRVTGCCLPIPLGMLVATTAFLRVAVARIRA